MAEEVTAALGRAPWERVLERRGYRHGTGERTLVISDGSQGAQAALDLTWPGVEHQRCAGDGQVTVGRYGRARSEPGGAVGVMIWPEFPPWPRAVQAPWRPPPPPATLEARIEQGARMAESVGARLRLLREQRGWTQSHLATLASVDIRTVQRIEANSGEPETETLRALASAFDMDVSKLLFGFSAETLAQFEETFLCPYCGAPLTSRQFVEHEYGDTEYEEFECGHTSGWRFRPCPKDPRFPAFEDYELAYFEENGRWWCYASGKTDMARAVSLHEGVGETKEGAERMVRRSYVWARDGLEAADRLYPLFG